MRFFTATARPVHVLWILDESASMAPYLDRVDDGMREFYARLKIDRTIRGVDYISTMIKIGDQATMAFHAAHVGVDEFPFHYRPDGSTALWDGIALGLHSIEIESQNEHQSVCCFIVTDGEENYSKQFDGLYCRGRIRIHKGRGNWSFLWLNMQGSVSEGAKLLEIDSLDFSRGDIAKVLADLAASLAEAAAASSRIGGPVSFAKFIEAGREKYR